MEKSRVTEFYIVLPTTSNVEEIVNTYKNIVALGSYI